MKTAAIIAGKAVAAAARLARLGSGTALPGLVAERLHPSLTRELASGLPLGCVLVTGTNGKTTTTKMIAGALGRSGRDVLSNESGSNLARGIGSCLLRSTSAFGRMRADVAALEVDEATMPQAIEQVRPRVVVVTNFLKDQLDRYGELDRVVDLVASALAGRPEATAVLNADDPHVAGIGLLLPGRVRYFGIESTAKGPRPDGLTEAAYCPRCSGRLEYAIRYFGHAGAWSCPSCGLARPPLDFAAANVRLTPRSCSFDLRTPEGSTPVTLPLPALYNVCNAVAAAAASAEMGVPSEVLADELRTFVPAFGRMETLSIDGRDVTLLLAKNPIAASQALSAILTAEGPTHIALVLNDNLSDSRDVSWTWDVDFEEFDLSGCRFVASGTRAAEMALRLKYAGMAAGDVVVERDPIAAVRRLVERTPVGQTAFVLPTYSAMLEIRNTFSRRGDRFARLGRVMKRGM
jgi:lipid II isoglutaminyl synthase (glutamine-hydrolysing)